MLDFAPASAPSLPFPGPMTQRILGPSLAVCALLLGACGSGTKSGESRAPVFQVSLTSLGMQGGTCAVNSIATNQDVVLTFNDLVAPASVSFTTFSVVNRLDGSSPAGQFLVQDNRVTFRPSLIETEAGVIFGFQEGAIYEFQLFADPESNVIRSIIGRPNTTPLTCAVSTNGIIDLVPGSPTVALTPNEGAPPTTREFPLTMVFNDLMQKAQLIDPVTLGSPSINVVVEDQTLASPVEIPVPGSFEIGFDQNALLTTLVFHPLGPYPGGKGGQRRLRVDFSSQISDLAGQPLGNPGSMFIPLIDVPSAPGSFAEEFDDVAQLDPAGSTDGLWANPVGVVDSGFDPVARVHQGGGSGVLGVFAPTSDFVFDTDSMVMSTITGQTQTITDGVFMFEEIHIPAGVTVSATGTHPLRLYCRGEMVVEGKLDLSGESAPTNFGKFFPRSSELIPGESTGGIFDFEAGGGDPGIGTLLGGSGGKGGMSWYLLDGVGTPQDPDYYDETNPNDFVSGNPDPLRYTDRIRWTTVHGSDGDGVGGVASTGNPELNPTALATDLANGAGMGSWAWPATSDQVPDAGFTTFFPIASHFDSLSSSWSHHAIHRSRGGGGGGFWTNGEPGLAFDPTSTDPLGDPLATPVVDPASSIWEFNDVLAWDQNAGGAIPDGGGGSYALPAGIETLDPSLGLLVGGGGGGGAGMSQHGSWSDDPNNTSGAIDTYRTCSGAGGGAGGGALQLHVGGRFSLSGQILARGGNGGDSEFMTSIPYPDAAAILTGIPGDAGGGGGAGGAILLQASGGMIVSADAIQLDGGRGGWGSAGNSGGAGGSGLLRVETDTGTEPLIQLQAMVSPDIAVELSPIGQPGVANVAPLHTMLSGSVGDFGPINGNASGVRSNWFIPDSGTLLLDFQGYQLDARYEASGNQTVLHYGSGTTFTQPGLTPIWIAFQTGWGPPGATEPDPATLSDWIIPGLNGVLDGLPELRSHMTRMVRFLIVFDQDQIDALIGGGPATNFFRVERLQLDWLGE